MNNFTRAVLHGHVQPHASALATHVHSAAGPLVLLAILVALAATLVSASRKRGARRAADRRTRRERTSTYAVDTEYGRDNNAIYYD